MNDKRWFEAVLWVAWTGEPWSRLPERFGKKSTVLRVLARRQGGSRLLVRLWRRYLFRLRDEEREAWRRALDRRGERVPLWRLEFKTWMELEWPAKKESGYSGLN